MLYPVYALLFADAGLSTSQISVLFAIWSVVSFAFEVPSGALADAWSRRGLYAIGELLTAAGYALWLIWPAFPGFALGFVLWGLGGALASGTLEALVYDQVGDDYAKVMGRAGTVGILATLAATLLAAPALTLGGYRLVGIASIAVVTLGGLLALRLPDSVRTPGEADDSDGGSYRQLLRSGLRDAVKDRRTILTVAVAAMLPGFTALDEYLPLLARDKGAPTVAVPLLYALVALAMAAGSALAGRYVASLPLVVAAAAALLAAGALVPHLIGMVPVAATFGLLQYAMIRAETSLQESITGPARTTVLSISGFGAEVFAVVLYAGFGLPVPLPPLFALAALPLLLTAVLAARNFVRAG
ncbi:MFS transporter [Actinoplanes sp. KI2]|uniref:MFS transporter n=1 Tax=Actinoplanes sp. KI2 TaxID=2983315 RepID=UPI0021D6024B|nr:MFS transporter [Actinoplanes sp. KI2]MCU7728745.1 MFS transporter [Actinoplanes sp. KI2]